MDDKIRFSGLFLKMYTVFCFTRENLWYRKYHVRILSVKIKELYLRGLDELKKCILYVRHKVQFSISFYRELWFLCQLNYCKIELFYNFHILQSVKNVYSFIFILVQTIQSLLYRPEYEYYVEINFQYVCFYLN